MFKREQEVLKSGCHLLDLDQDTIQYKVTQVQISFAVSDSQEFKQVLKTNKVIQNIHKH